VDEDRKPGAAGAGDSLKEPPPASPARDTGEPRAQRLPRHLRRRLDASAEAWCQSAQAGASEVPFVRERVVIDHRAQRRGWYAAAACLVLAVAGWWPRLAHFADDAAHGISPTQTDAERAREHLLRTGGERVGRWAWTHESGLAADVHGEVVWDGERQEGYLTLSGLEPNAPAGRQYQLWIFDAARDDRYPVDGGVFDVPVHSQTMTVPIRPALHVSQPVAFAVTLERVGGVVVSDRSHLMALARAGGH
jgi:Anti-sigma-K factor rskA, C-terminal